MALAKPVLQVVIGSTRPGRVGGAVAQWFYDLAQDAEGFEVELIDLAEVNLPLFDEPHHPQRQQYTHEHTKRWSQIVGRADALVFVIPEYNHSMNAAIKNAIDFLYHEWRYKPFGVVSYGGGARGLRAAQALKLSLVSLKMPFAGDVGIGLAQTPVVDGVFAANEQLAASAKTLLEELVRLTPTFQTLRA
jgi:NAD(P)H-dependent FMN reductase